MPALQLLAVSVTPKAVVAGKKIAATYRVQLVGTRRPIQFKNIEVRDERGTLRAAAGQQRRRGSAGRAAQWGAQQQLLLGKGWWVYLSAADNNPSSLYLEAGSVSRSSSA